MTAISLFDKQTRAARGQPKVVVTDAQQLNAWLERGKAEVFTATTMLTPELARLLLAANEDNRNVQLTSRGTRSVEAYADMMRRGEWLLNGSTLVVASNGQLNDGQHRCLACIDAGVAVPVQIAFGVERETRSTLDQGRARTPGDVLKILDPSLTDVNILATYLNFRYCLLGGRNPSERTTPDELRDALGVFPNGREHIASIAVYARRMKLSVGFMAGAHGMCFDANPRAAEAFCSAVSTGLGIETLKSPVARLRDAYDKAKGKNGSALHRDTQAALYVKGFNNFVRGRLGALSFRPGGAPEVFPAVVTR